MISEMVTVIVREQFLILMKGLKDILTMSRRERQGTIALLAVIALLLVATVVVRSCRHESTVDPPRVEVQQLEADVDTVDVVVKEKAIKRQDGPSKQQESPSKRSPKRFRHPKRTKPAHAPRPLDPVPAF